MLSLRKIFLLLTFLFPVSSFAQSAAISTPELKVPNTIVEWQKERTSIRETLVKVMGNLPPRPTIPVVRVLTREDKGTYVVEKFEFDNGAGALVPGYFLIPKNGKAKHPAIFYCHWHGGNYDLGKQEIFSTHHTPKIPAQVLTDLGYAVLAIDAYCFGERSGKGPGGPKETGAAEELSASKYELWMGRSLWTMMVRDDLMALDYLFSREEVDSTRVAVTGISMGATRSWWLMALDERIKAGVAVGCLTRYQQLMAEQKLKAHGIYYFVPGFLRYFDTEAVIGLIAPRPFLFMTGDHDAGSPVSGIKKIEEVVQKVYHLNKADENFKSIIYPDTGHVYTADMWDKMTKWMNVHLK
jgi:dipeptidyl aminopeptidase/acylaminoacyl peptidase